MLFGGKIGLSEGQRAAKCRGNPCTTFAHRTTFRLDSPVQHPLTDPFQIPSKLGHLSYPSSRRLRTTFPSHEMP